MIFLLFEKYFFDRIFTNRKNQICFIYLVSSSYIYTQVKKIFRLTEYYLKKNKNRRTFIQNVNIMKYNL